MTEARRKPSAFGWGFATAFFAIPTFVTLLLSASFKEEAGEWLQRLNHLDALPAGERSVSGQVQPASGRPLLTAPASGRACLAWEAGVSVSWDSKDSNDNWVSNSSLLRQRAAATRMLVVDARAGVLATIDLPRVELLAASDVKAETGIPAWSEGFDVMGADSTESSRTYSSYEKVLLPGDTVTFFAKSGERVAPLDGHERLVLFVGEPGAWRDELQSKVTASWWLSRVGMGLGAVAALCALGLARALWLRRSS